MRKCFFGRLLFEGNRELAFLDFLAFLAFLAPLALLALLVLLAVLVELVELAEPAPLARERMRSQVIIKGIAIKISNRNRRLVVEEDLIAAYLADRAKIDKEGAMDAKETVCRQTVLYALHGKKRHDRTLLTDQMETKIRAHRLNVTDVADIDANHLIVRLEENGIINRQGRKNGRVTRSFSC